MRRPCSEPLRASMRRPDPSLPPTLVEPHRRACNELRRRAGYRASLVRADGLLHPWATLESSVDAFVDVRIDPTLPEGHRARATPQIDPNSMAIIGVTARHNDIFVISVLLRKEYNKRKPYTLNEYRVYRLAHPCARGSSMNHFTVAISIFFP